MSWTTPDDVSARVLRLWDRGKILAAPLMGEAMFPMTLPLSCPSARALSDRFDEVRAWIRLLEDGSKSKKGAGRPRVSGRSTRRRCGTSQLWQRGCSAGR